MELERKSYSTEQVREILGIETGWLDNKRRELKNRRFSDLSEIEELCVGLGPNPPTLLDYLQTNVDFWTMLRRLENVRLIGTERRIAHLWATKNMPAIVVQTTYSRQHVHQVRTKIVKTLNLDPPSHWRLAWRWPGVMAWKALYTGVQDRGYLEDVRLHNNYVRCRTDALWEVFT